MQVLQIACEWAEHQEYGSLLGKCVDKRNGFAGIFSDLAWSYHQVIMLLDKSDARPNQQRVGQPEMIEELALFVYLRSER